jgi:hypothetical protein
MLVQQGDELFETFSREDIERLGEGTIGEAVSKHQEFLAGRVSERGKIDFARVLDELQPPAALKDFLGAKDSVEVMERMLATKDQPRTVANFFEWYRHALGERRQRFDEQEKPTLLTNLDTNLAAAAKAGIIPDFLPDRMRRLQEDDKLHVKLADHSLLMGGGRTGGALHFANGEELVWLQLGYEQEHTFTHESLHTIEGTAGKPGDQLGPEMNKENRGLYRLFGATKGGEVMNEAVIEHTADSILYGHVDAVLPTSEERKNSIDHYAANRFLLYVLCERGIQSIHPQAFIDATFEDGSAEESRALQQLKEQLSSAFPGFNVIERLGDMEASDPWGVADFLKKFVEDWDRFLDQKQHQAAPSTSPRPLAKISDTAEGQSHMTEAEKVILKFLANNQGHFNQYTPPRPSLPDDITTTIGTELAALRADGQSEKKALRTLAKRYHSDTNQNPEAGGKIRAVNQQLEDFNRQEGEKIAKGK